MTQHLERLGKRSPQPGTAEFIKSHLQKIGSDYICHTYKVFCQKLRDAGQQQPSYDSFRRYWWVCAQLGLIEFVREEPSGNLKARRYYQLVTRNVGNKAWRNPQAGFDLKKGRTVPDPITGKPIPVSRLGRRRYRRRVLGSPPKPVGRPRKPRPQTVKAATVTHATPS